LRTRKHPLSYAERPPSSDATMLNVEIRHAALLLALSVGSPWPPPATKLTQPTAEAFQRYVQRTEARMQSELTDPQNFLYFDSLPEQQRHSMLARLHNGQVVIEPMRTLDNGREIQVPNGLVHHWLAIGFIPGATLAQVVALAQDYPRHPELYAPDVQRARVLSHVNQHFSVYYRFYRHAIVTAVFNTEFSVDYFLPDASRGYSLARSVRIAELQNPGKPAEKELPVGNDHGYLWRLNLYARYLEKDNAVYIQIEFVALSRAVPEIVAWLVNPCLRSIPRAYLTNYLHATQKALSPENTHSDMSSFPWEKPDSRQPEIQINAELKPGGDQKDEGANNAVPGRIFWIIPKFMAANNQPENQRPSAPRQKYNIAWHQSSDESAHFGNLVQASISKAANGIPQYGKGWEAYGKRFAAQGASPRNSSNQTASLHGTVTTSQNNAEIALAGVTVKLSRDPPAGTPLSAGTDENGRYEFQSLPVGAYSITVEAAGFKAITRSIVLNSSQQNLQDFTLQLDVVTEKVEVNETASAISTESAAAPPATVTSVELITLPTAQEKVKEVLPITPGVIRTLDSKLTLKGADENQSLMLVNSARTTDPVTGSFGVPIPTDAVQSFAVYKTPYDATLGSFSGGLTTVETKPPEDEWSYKLRGLVPSIIGKNGHIEGIAEGIPGIAFNVPIIRHKLLLSEVFQYEMKKTTVEGLPWPYDISKRQGFNSFTTIEAILAPNHVLTLTVNAFPLRQQNVDISALVPQPASNDLNQRGMAVGLNDKYQLGSGAIFSVVAQYMRFDSNAHGQGTADMLITPEGWGGNYFNQSSRRGKEFQAVPSYQFSEKHWKGKHQIRVGDDIDYRSFFGTTASHPIQLLRQDNSLAEEITFGPAPSQTPSDSSVAEFVQDHWVINPHWSLDLGARLSTESSGWSAAFAPRAGLAYSPGKGGRTVIRAGAGMFYGVLPLLAANFAANPTRTITEFDATGMPTGPAIIYTNVYAGGLNPLLAPVLPTQPDTTPRNVTWNAEVDREIRKDLRLKVGYLDSHTTYLFDVDPFTAAPGGDSFMGLTNTGSSHYRELEATAHYTFREHDQVNASYIWSRARGDLNSLSNVAIPFAAPVIRPNVYGILPSDAPNRLIAWGIFALPRKLTFSPLADIHSGFPYSALDVRQEYVGVPNGQRFPEYFSLDLKLYRQFRIPFFGSQNGKAHHIRLGVYTLNVTNHDNFSTVYNNVMSPNFGRFVGLLYRHEGAIIELVD
jgi:hypothetical protein